ncbi:MAG TPA: hydantoinase B/oxoprolinase family protein [Nitrososphaerales archaeon]|nr:hydantoinase B/oxoprolinase family protein [Nitrososphaerales archaeon]
MKPDNVTLQIISHSLLYTSEEMGLALRNSAYSPNINERMDHSAALFDPGGRLLAQAEHIPVHLGSLPWGLKNLIDYLGREGMAFEEGSMIAANDPYITGTHLNDVTVAAPIHHGGKLVAFAVNKAHHADVGGSVPGSISMDAHTLSEEGFILKPSVLWRKKDFVESVVERFATASRTPVERRGDLKAQVAANLLGTRRVKEVIDRHGLEAFKRAAVRAFRHSETLSRRMLSGFRSGTYEATDVVEGPRGEDLKIRASVRISKSGIVVDYSGTSKEVDFPLNAVFGVTVSGVFFVLRCLLGDDIPANHGAFSFVTVRAPPGTLLSPTRPHPVGGGNVETSQRNADVIFRALSSAARHRVPAAAGGSMNNVMIGGDKAGSPWAFYETIGVGLGAGTTWDGIDGIQANMTNTMNTPIEEIERSLPLRIVKYEFRPDSSGSGRRRGGSGLVRAYMSLSDGTTFTILADREKHSPWGLHGGGPGGRTEVLLERSRKQSRIPSKSTMVMRKGDVIEIRTAGGGGYGSPRAREKPKIIRDVINGLLTPVRAEREYSLKTSKFQLARSKAMPI